MYFISSFLLNKKLTAPHGMGDLSSPARDQTHAPPQWKSRVLTPGLPGASQCLLPSVYMFLKLYHGKF